MSTSNPRLRGGGGGDGGGSEDDDERQRDDGPEPVSSAGPEGTGDGGGGGRGQDDPRGDTGSAGPPGGGPSPDRGDGAGGRDRDSGQAETAAQRQQAEGAGDGGAPQTPREFQLRVSGGRVFLVPSDGGQPVEIGSQPQRRRTVRRRVRQQPGPDRPTAGAPPGIGTPEERLLVRLEDRTGVELERGRDVIFRRDGDTLRAELTEQGRTRIALARQQGIRGLAPAAERGVERRQVRAPADAGIRGVAPAVERASATMDQMTAIAGMGIGGVSPDPAGPPGETPAEFGGPIPLQGINVLTGEARDVPEGLSREERFFRRLPAEELEDTTLSERLGQFSQAFEEAVVDPVAGGAGDVADAFVFTPGATTGRFGGVTTNPAAAEPVELPEGSERLTEAAVGSTVRFLDPAAFTLALAEGGEFAVAGAEAAAEGRFGRFEPRVRGVDPGAVDIFGRDDPVVRGQLFEGGFGEEITGGAAFEAGRAATFAEEDPALAAATLGGSLAGSSLLFQAPGIGPTARVLGQPFEEAAERGVTRALPGNIPGGNEELAIFAARRGGARAAAGARRASARLSDLTGRVSVRGRVGAGLVPPEIEIETETEGGGVGGELDRPGPIRSQGTRALDRPPMSPESRALIEESRSRLSAESGFRRVGRERGGAREDLEPIPMLQAGRELDLDTTRPFFRTELAPLGDGAGGLLGTTTLALDRLSESVAPEVGTTADVTTEVVTDTRVDQEADTETDVAAEQELSQELELETELEQEFGFEVAAEPAQETEQEFEPEIELEPEREREDDPFDLELGTADDDRLEPGGIEGVLVENPVATGEELFGGGGAFEFVGGGAAADGGAVDLVGDVDDAAAAAGAVAVPDLDALAGVDSGQTADAADGGAFDLLGVGGEAVDVDAGLTGVEFDMGDGLDTEPLQAGAGEFAAMIGGAAATGQPAAGGPVDLAAPLMGDTGGRGGAGVGPETFAFDVDLGVGLGGGGGRGGMVDMDAGLDDLTAALDGGEGGGGVGGMMFDADFGALTNVGGGDLGGGGLDNYLAGFDDMF